MPLKFISQTVIDQEIQKAKKPTAYKAGFYPYNDLANRLFEILNNQLFKEKIYRGDFQSKFDQIHLMQGVGEQGRDSMITYEGKSVGLIQCKKHKENLSPASVGKEVLKFILYSFINPALIHDITNFTYYFSVSTGFSETAISLISNFNEVILEESNLKEWSQNIIKKFTSLNKLIYEDIEVELKRRLSLIKLEKLTPEENLESWLSEFPHVAALFFEVRIVVDNSKMEAVDRRLKSIEEHLETPISKKRKQFPSKILYPPVPNYIDRYISAVSDNTPIDVRQGYLKDLLIKQKKIALLGISGIGKSTELDHLAHYLSNVAELYAIRVNLNTYVDSDLVTFIEAICSGWENIPADKLVLIFDGLDEVHAQEFELVCRKLPNLINRFPGASIVVSCRNNFYTLNRLAGFFPYYLTDLTNVDIATFIQKELLSDSEGFNRSIDSKSLRPLLKSPFYLINLIHIYKKNNDLPNSRVDIFETIIELKLTKDIEHFLNNGKDIAGNEVLLKKSIKIIALTMVTLGRNYISEEEFQLLFPDIITRDLIKYAFLLYKSETAAKYSWKFEHNNFQEYLAAKILSHQNLDTIIKFIAIDPQYLRVKPSWINTLSFVFGLLELNSSSFNNLLTWLTKNEPESLIRFEKDKIALEVRETIFQSIFNFYTKRGIFIRSEHFTPKELIEFVEDSESIRKLILETIEAVQDESELIEHIKWFSRFPDAYPFNIRAEALFKGLATDGQHSPEVQYQALEALSSLKINSEDLTTFLLSKLNLKSSSSIRSGLYLYLNTLEQPEKHLKLILEGIPLLDKERNNKAILGGNTENRDLLALLVKIESPEDIKLILSFFTKNPKLLATKTNLIEAFELICKQATKAFKKNESVFESMLLLALGLRIQANPKEFVIIKKFLKHTGTTKKAIEVLLVEYRGYIPKCICGAIADEECIRKFVALFRQKLFLDQEVNGFRHGLSINSVKHLKETFLDAINPFSNHRFMYVPTIDWDLIKQNRYKRDLELLFDQEAFFQEVKSVFILEEKESFTLQELENLQHKELQEESLTNNLIIDILLERAEHHAISASYISTYYSKKETWDWFKISALIADFDIYRPLLKNEWLTWVKDWAYNASPKANFKPTLSGAILHTNLERAVTFLFRKLDLDFSTEIMLDMLLMDEEYYLFVGQPEQRLSNYIFSRVQPEDFKEKILTNLKSGINFKRLLRSHIQTCIDYQYTEAIPIIIEAINGNILDKDDKLDTLQALIKLKPSITIIEQLRNVPEFDFKFEIANQLLTMDSHKGINFLLTILQQGQNEPHQLLTIAFTLIKKGRIEGLRYFRSWLIESKKGLELNLDESHLMNLPSAETLDLLLDILFTSYDPDFENSKFYNFNRVIEKSIISLALRTELIYRNTSKSIHDFIQTYSSANKNVNQLNGFLLELEKKFFTGKIEKLSFQQAQTLIALLTQ